MRHKCLKWTCVYPWIFKLYVSNAINGLSSSRLQVKVTNKIYMTKLSYQIKIVSYLIVQVYLMVLKWIVEV